MVGAGHIRKRLSDENIHNSPDCNESSSTCVTNPEYGGAETAAAESGDRVRGCVSGSMRSHGYVAGATLILIVRPSRTPEPRALASNRERLYSSSRGVRNRGWSWGQGG
jgi:hypothetical protein